jgi:transcriptional regulator with XRE-family HTH domain
MSEVNAEVEGILHRLIESRKAAGLSQGQVAKLLGLSGSAATISQWERGGRGLDLHRLLQLRDLYGISIEWLMTGVNPHFDLSDLVTAARADKLIDQLKSGFGATGEPMNKVCFHCGSDRIVWGQSQDVRAEFPYLLKTRDYLWTEYTCLNCGYQGIGKKPYRKDQQDD